MRGLYLLLPMLLVVGCSEPVGLAPVVELQWQPRIYNQTTHIVKRGETLYSVAFRYDKDFRQLAAYNHLNSPYALRVGQVIHLQNSSTHRRATTYYKPASSPVKAVRKPISSAPRYTRSQQTSTTVRWVWPAKGRVVVNFIPQQGKKGIDIAGSKGETVHAAANGIVAYAGSGLSGYGNLIIIKHDGQFLTAYGNNSRNRVVEGQRVKAGQIIADMGIVDRKFWGVHFEIRKAGQPVNPMSYIRR